jgi:hypothetical protein
VAASRQAFARKYAHCLLVASPTAQCVTATGYFYLLPQSAVLLPFAATNRAIAGLTTLDFSKNHYKIKCIYYKFTIFSIE